MSSQTTVIDISNFLLKSTELDVLITFIENNVEDKLLLKDITIQNSTLRNNELISVKGSPKIKH